MAADDVWMYEPILEEDCAEMRNLCAERFPLTEWVLIYPHGHYSAESERILHAQGFRVTVTCDPGIAQLRRGDAESLYLLPRISVWPGMTAADVLARVEGKR